MERHNNMKKENPYKVPDNYFEEVTEKIMDQTRSSSKHRKERSIPRIIKPAVMMAAAMIGLVIISYTGLRILFPEKDQIYLSTLTEITEYAMSEINESEIIDHLLLEGEDFLPDDSENSFNEEIIEYLIDNNIDYSTILEHF